MFDDTYEDLDPLKICSGCGDDSTTDGVTDEFTGAYMCGECLGWDLTTAEEDD
jgi:hypothetical protein